MSVKFDENGNWYFNVSRELSLEDHFHESFTRSGIGPFGRFRGGRQVIHLLSIIPYRSLLVHPLSKSISKK